jgi:hypothetical protein
VHVEPDSVASSCGGMASRVQRKGVHGPGHGSALDSGGQHGNRQTIGSSTSRTISRCFAVGFPRRIVIVMSEVYSLIPDPEVEDREARTRDRFVRKGGSPSVSQSSVRARPPGYRKTGPLGPLLRVSVSMNIAASSSVEKAPDSIRSKSPSAISSAIAQARSSVPFPRDP